MPQLNSKIGRRLSSQLFGYLTHVRIGQTESKLESQKLRYTHTRTDEKLSARQNGQIIQRNTRIEENKPKHIPACRSEFLTPP